MTGIKQTLWYRSIWPGLQVRGAALIGCALVVYFASARPVIAQSSKLHAAFEVVEASNSVPNEPSPGTVRLVSGQQQPVAKPLKPAPKPVTKKASPTLTAETHSPAKVEPLPPGPMK